MGDLLRSLLNGVLENIREWWCYLTTKSELLIPTYFSCGLLNIQSKQDNVFIEPHPAGAERLEPSSKPGKKHKVVRTIEKLFRLIGEDFKRCTHTFEHLDNFCIENRRIKILDYGAKGFKKLIQNYEKELEEAFKELIEK